MYWAYSFALFLSLFYYVPSYLIKLKIRKGESLNLKKRFGLELPNVNKSDQSVWIHAVSVGEVLSLRNLIGKFKERNPGWSVYLSVLTNSGYKVASEKLTNVSGIFYIPFDFTLIVRKFFRVIKPNLFILAESEFWPNLLKEAKRNCAGVLLINGRISEKSFKGYKRVKYFIKKVLSKIDYFMVQTEREENGLIKLGIPPRKIARAGNLKTEIELPLLSGEMISDLKQKLGVARGKKIILAGSTHQGEEAQILQAFSEAKKANPDITLMIAPRHPERAEEVEKYCRDLSLSSMRKSKKTANGEWEVLIVDTLGELAFLYALCDLAFIGGSLVDKGGQNFLEPAFYEKPVFFGPHMNNFEDLANIFIRSDAARIVEGHDSLKELFQFRDMDTILRMGKNAGNTLRSLQGSTEKTIELIEMYTRKL
jgi:3-deoxy-D-manno-octulosonic-acid transferase